MPEHLTPVDIEDLRGDPGRLVGEQEQARTDHVLGWPIRLMARLFFTMS